MQYSSLTNTAKSLNDYYYYIRLFNLFGVHYKKKESEDDSLRYAKASYKCITLGLSHSILTELLSESDLQIG